MANRNQQKALSAHRRKHYGTEVELAIDTYMKRHDLTQIEFARLLGVDHSTVSNWRKGFRMPSAKVITRIAARRDMDGILNAVAKQKGLEAVVLRLDAFLRDPETSAYASAIVAERVHAVLNGVDRTTRVGIGVSDQNQYRD